MNIFTAIKAIFEFRFSIQDIGLQRGGVGHPHGGKKKENSFFLKFDFFPLGHFKGTSYLMENHFFDQDFPCFMINLVKKGNIAFIATCPK